MSGLYQGSSENRIRRDRCGRRAARCGRYFFSRLHFIASVIRCSGNDLQLVRTHLPEDGREASNFFPFSSSHFSGDGVLTGEIRLARKVGKSLQGCVARTQSQPFDFPLLFS